MGRISPRGEIRSQRQKPTYFEKKNLILLKTKVLGASMVALDMNSSACGAAALMTGDKPTLPTVDSTAA